MGLWRRLGGILSRVSQVKFRSCKCVWAWLGGCVLFLTFGRLLIRMPTPLGCQVSFQLPYRGLTDRVLKIRRDLIEGKACLFPKTRGSGLAGASFSWRLSM